MTDQLIEIIEDNTALVKDTDLFYLEMPLGKSGLWFMDRQTDSKFNGVNHKEYDIFYRGKDKQTTMANIAYFKDAIDSIDSCELDDGTSYRLVILYEWDYLEKDAEGYYVFANTLRLII